jgi:hypothetical protein
MLTVVLVGCLTAEALALGTEGFGNAALPAGYVQNQALLPLANHKHRVYWQEINGDLRLSYRGPNEALNEFLRQFAGTAEPVREVILLPGPGETMTFDRRKLGCDWVLHIPGGLYLHRATKENGTQVMEKHTTLTIYVSRVAPPTPPDAKQLELLVGQLEDDKFAVREKALEELIKLGHAAAPKLRTALESNPPRETRRRIEAVLDRLTGIDLELIKFPSGVRVLDLNDLRKRYEAGLKSGEHDIRGQAVAQLAHLAQYTDDTIPLVIGTLTTDKHEYVRRCAAGALGNLGARAKAALPVLKEGLKDPDANIRGTFEQMIDWIEKAPVASPTEMARFQAIQKQIAAQQAARPSN